MNDNPTIQHTLNGVAALAAPVSILTHAPEFITVIAGVLGIIWYSILIGEKLHKWRTDKRWPRNSLDD